ncbi:MAG: hypothetical protein OXT06_10005 [Rhodospirillaceae bacterium]|nr:hypothetical protein [Rhodospirillaceae bacterium]
MLRIDPDLERQSEHALTLARAAREASPEQARKLGELAASILHRVVTRGKYCSPESIENSVK